MRFKRWTQKCFRERKENWERGEERRESERNICDYRRQAGRQNTKKV